MVLKGARSYSKLTVLLLATIFINSSSILLALLKQEIAFFLFAISIVLTTICSFLLTIIWILAEYPD